MTSKTTSLTEAFIGAVLTITIIALAASAIEILEYLASYGVLITPVLFLAIFTSANYVLRRIFLMTHELVEE